MPLTCKEKNHKQIERDKDLFSSQNHPIIDVTFDIRC